MNRLLGIVSLNGNSRILDGISQCPFQSPYWQADHQAIFSSCSIAFSATARFITPECSHGLMPIHHQASGCVLIFDGYLTNRQTLCQQLNCEPHLSDGELILQAYLKWGESCTTYFAGAFIFAIWNEKHETLIAATDQFASRPYYYAYKPGHYFIFANEMSPFRVLCSTLTMNDALFKGYALDALEPDETCYVEVKKLLPAHRLSLNAKRLSMHRYWSLKDQKRTVYYRTREDYFQAFREIFKTSVNNVMRTSYALSAHISGGLDSSAIACQAALLLAEKNQSLYAVTAIPIGLDGPSYRKGWYYHEMPRVQSVLQQYSNIEHEVYTTSSNMKIYETLAALYPYLDQPIRNVFNFDWISHSLEYARHNNSRVMLMGQHGNAGFSWAGVTLKNRLGVIYHALRQKIFQHNVFAEYYQYTHPHVLNSAFGTQRIQKRTSLFNRRYRMLSGVLNAPLFSTMHAMSLWHGVELMDPTRDLALIHFCYYLPEWVHYSGNTVLQKRLQVREGLSGLVPEAILQNPYRGEQGADWYLQYNCDAEQWQNDIQNIAPEAQDILWQCYDQSKIMALFDEFSRPIQRADDKSTLAIGFMLTRCLSSGFFLNYLKNAA